LLVGAAVLVLMGKSPVRVAAGMFTYGGTVSYKCLLGKSGLRGERRVGTGTDGKRRAAGARMGAHKKKTRSP
jgi:hypothetical protein